jgi:hypothetical protein
VNELNIKIIFNFEIMDENYVEIVCKFANKKEENHKTNSYCFAFISPPFFTLKKVIIYLQKLFYKKKKPTKAIYVSEKLFQNKILY